ncbi:MAG: MBL fold metallo-hydrolase [Spirochaetes bacterium]|nr:MBL fold metallo-hydrolase [Spirochaetota bacterium]
MIVKFWGVRGSTPTPLSPAEFQVKIKKLLTLSNKVDLSNDEKVDNFLNNLPLSIRSIYGGNTPCVSVEADDTFIILDMGSGARPLGNELMQKPHYQNGGTFHVFLSHTHWDHIQGLPFFSPIYNPKFKLIFYSPFADIKQRLAFQQQEAFFPAKLEDIPCEKEFRIIKDQKIINIDDNLKVEWKRMVHPGDSFSYKITHNNKSMVYATDAEFYKIDEAFMEEVSHLWKGAELLIFDAQYTPEEYINKISWGHSSTIMSVDIALQSESKRLVLFHHEPAYSDELIENTLSRAEEYLATIAPDSSLKIIPAYEGLVFEI